MAAYGRRMSGIGEQKTTGGTLVVRSLLDAGIEEVFTLHGGHLDAFYAAAADSPLRITDTRHESTAGHAADAYARQSGRPGVCVVTSGPGFTNVVTAITNAYLDAVPVLFIIGASPLREAETNSLQGGFDQIAMATPVTKWAHRVTEVSRLPELIAQALRTACAGRPGPVLIEVPIDVLFRPVDEGSVRFPAPVRLPPAPEPAQVAVDEALALLEQAARPVLLAGGGVHLSGCEAEVLAFAERTNVPVFTPNKADGVVPANHPLWGGGFIHLGFLGPVTGQVPDVVMLVGSRAGLFTGGRASAFPGAKLIQIDLEAAELARIHDVDVPILADCGAAMIAFERRARERSWPDRSEWLAVIHAVHGAPAQIFPDPATPSGRIHPHYAAQAVVDAAPDRTVFVLDGGETGFWVDPVLRPSERRSVVRIGYLGGLGVGPGFAVGARRADPSRPVIQVTGDGAVGLHLADFDTMARHDLPIVTVIFNNASWGMSLHGQEAVYGESGVVASRLADSDYELAAQAFGLYSERVTRLEDIGDAIGRAFASGRPACLNVEIDASVVHPLTTLMVGDVNATNEIVVPYYENIPLTQGVMA